MLGRILKNYIARHRHPLNQALHWAGVPLTFVASVIVLVAGHPWWALGCFVGGYALQFAGHAIEGNDAGEMVLLKKFLGRSYTEFGPERSRAESGSSARCSPVSTTNRRPDPSRHEPSPKREPPSSQS